MFLRSAAILLCVLLAGCSTPKQAATQVVSIAAEAELFTEFVRDGHASPAYVSTHPDYLKRLATAASKEVDKSGVEELKQQMQRLKVSLDRLAGSPIDPALLAALHDDFAEIARAAARIGESI